MDQFREYGFHSVQVCKLELNFGELGLCVCACLNTACTIVKLQQLRGLVQAEPQPLRRLDEVQSRQVILVVTPNAALGPFRLGHQPLALLEPNGLQVDTGSLGQITDGQPRAGMRK